ncbi:hypothetical protein K461DRAFT_296452 [Myriangium duriaei CBS 260.36]|uniref:Uncharacterized protein n=1 Tax=Myriangium duriaei CBS 260.36 TaxID=1168546 RepID=A0A9P4J091_9PEZI|nr:hypothetical protein K461DRAFT_296452 [Myriangium duriaei CBS 260.36]
MSPRPYAQDLLSLHTAIPFVMSITRTTRTFLTSGKSSSNLQHTARWACDPIYEDPDAPKSSVGRDQPLTDHSPSHEPAISHSQSETSAPPTRRTGPSAMARRFYAPTYREPTPGQAQRETDAPQTVDGHRRQHARRLLQLPREPELSQLAVDLESAREQHTEDFTALREQIQSLRDQLADALFTFQAAQTVLRSRMESAERAQRD